MGTIVITGSASGIGAATAARLTGDGHRVIGVDLQNADVEVDLSGPDGRATMVEAVYELSGGSISGLLAGAGISQGPGERVAAINYFGAVATLEGLRPLLAAGEGGAAVAISSNSATTAPQLDGLADACLDGDEVAAKALAATDSTGLVAYPATKLALARWVRQHAVTADWIGASVRMNAIAPGYIATPMTAGGWDFVRSLGDEVYPIPIDRPGTPEEMAALIAFLLSPEAGFFVGSVVFADGGTDAKMNPLRL